MNKGWDYDKAPMPVVKEDEEMANPHMHRIATGLLGTMALAATSQAADAMELTSVQRALEVTAFHDDGERTSFDETLTEADDQPFDQALRYTADSFGGQFTFDSGAAQVSSIELLDARSFRIVADMDVATFIGLNHFDNPDGVADTTTAAGIAATFRSNLPIDYHLVGTVEIQGEGGGAIRVFDLNDFWMSGTSFDVTGRAPAGEHTLSSSIQVGSASRGADAFSNGTMSFVLTGVVAPTPAAVGPGLVLLGGLLLRRRRG